MAFYVGQKVVAIADPGDGHEYFIHPAHKLGAAEPVVGEVYTIRAFVKSKVQERFSFLALAEIRNEPMYLPAEGGLIEVAWPEFRFRPIFERKTDISIFTDMLTPKTEQVSA